MSLLTNILTMKKMRILLKLRKVVRGILDQQEKAVKLQI